MDPQNEQMPGEAPDNPYGEAPVEAEPEAPPSNKNNEMLAIVSLVCGVLGGVGWCLPFCGCPVAVGGLICGGFGLKSRHKTMAIIGMALSAISFILTLINAAFGVYMKLKKGGGF